MVFLRRIPMPMVTLMRSGGAAEFLWGSTSSTGTSALVLEQGSIDSCDRHRVRAESLGYVRSHKELLPSRRLYVASERFGLEHTSE